jgi:hypothetical protein
LVFKKFRIRIMEWMFVSASRSFGDDSAPHHSKRPRQIVEVLSESNLMRWRGCVYALWNFLDHLFIKCFQVIRTSTRN